MGRMRIEDAKKMCVRVRGERREDDAELLELGMTAINVLDGRTSRNDGLEINTIFNLPPLSFLSH